jgi:hypothetical protein
MMKPGKRAMMWLGLPAAALLAGSAGLAIASAASHPAAGLDSATSRTAPRVARSPSPVPTWDSTPVPVPTGDSTPVPVPSAAPTPVPTWDSTPVPVPSAAPTPVPSAAPTAPAGS